MRGERELRLRRQPSNGRETVVLTEALPQMPNQGKEKIDRGWIEVHQEECKGCGLCVEACPVCGMKLSDRLNGRGYHFGEYEGHGCTGCGVCFYACPEPGAITVLTLKK
jgi:NAD-dependent dihydropyrimidine dehydrogenase PreA subunit